MTNIDTKEALDVRAVFRLVTRCWPYYRPQLKHILTYIGCTLLIGALFFSFWFVADDLIQNKIGVGEPLQPLQAHLLMLDESYLKGDDEPKRLSEAQRKQVRANVVIFTLTFVFVVFVGSSPLSYYQVWIFQRVNQKLRVEMLSKAEHLSLKHHNFSRTGDAMYRVYQDSATITNVLQWLVTMPLRVMGVIIIGCITLIFFSAWFALPIFFSIILSGYVMRKLLPVIRQKSRQSREYNSDLTSRIQENLAAVRVIKASGAEDIMISRFKKESQNALDAAFEMRFYNSVLLLLSILIGMGSLIIAEYFMATWAITEKATSLGGIVALVGYATWNIGAYQTASRQGEQTSLQAWELSHIFSVAQDLTVGLKRAFHLLDLEPEVTEPSQPKIFPVSIQSIQFESVYFNYQKDNPVLAGIDLTATVGSVTAIVGGTGSGKSTLMSLLLRLYDPDHGNILVNGINLKEMSRETIKSNVAIALQQNVLFALSISDNIRYGRDDLSEKDVHTAAKIACADGFIAAMPEGFSTELGERGGKLSTGQRQRLSIARAVLRDTPILILDEPTASLDAETEQRVMKNLTIWGKNRIVFIITHRLSTIRSADQIAFLNKGKIVEAGTHIQLMAQLGPYSDFVTAELGNTPTEKNYE